jgi:hypothetical protein
MIRFNIGVCTFRDLTVPDWRVGICVAELGHQIDGDAVIKLRSSTPSRMRKSQAKRQASRMLLNCRVYYTGINGTPLVLFA